MNILLQAYQITISPHRQLVRQIRRLTGLVPHRILLYKMAFTHSSASPEAGFNNERLELIGDSVFDVVVTEYLYYKYPFKSEGFLTEMRAKIVSRKTINEVARKMGLQDYVTTTMTDRHLMNSSTLGNALEALIGAVYMDRGFSGAKRFIRKKLLRSHFNLEELEQTVFNFKSRLIQYGQKNNIPVAYEQLKEIKTKQGKKFTMGVFFNGELIAQHTAPNKKHAEQEASREAWDKLGLTD